MRLPLRIIRRRGPEAVADIAARAFNLFVNAGPRLTNELRDYPLVASAVATSTGLLKVREGSLLVEIEREIELLPPPSRSGPKLQGKSELVAEALMELKTADPLPSLAQLAKLASGFLDEAVSISQVQKVLARLQEDGALKVDRSRGPKYTHYFDLRKDELLRLWAKEFMPGVTRSMSLYVTARDPSALLRSLKKEGLVGRWAVSGASAAQIWRPMLTPGPEIEIWADDLAWDHAAAVGQHVDPGIANLTVRRLAGAQPPLWFAHHHLHGDLPVISPARAFVEASVSRGPRFDELADALFETIA